jgi:hypothetical protein
MAESVPFGPEPGVVVEVLGDGGLELSSRLNDGVYRAGPAVAAMWIALCRNGWSVAGAAGELARVWRVDEVNLRADLDILVAELCDVGLLARQV